MASIVTPNQLELRADLYHQLSAMTTAGVTLPNALELLQRNPPRRALKPILAGLIVSLEAGESFTESLRRQTGWLPAFDIALIEAGEKSGRLDACFALLANHNRDQAALMRDVIGQLIYPFFLVHFATLVLPVSLLVGLVLRGEWVMFFLPKLIFLGTIYTVIGVTLFAGQGRHGEAWRARVEEFLGWVPVLGKARRELALARLAAALEALLNAGVPTIPAWELAAAASGSPALRREIQSWGARIEAGIPPSELMKASLEFPEIFSHLYTTAEHSGKIDETLIHLHAQFRDRGMRNLKLFTRGALFLVFFIVAVLIAIQIIAFYVGYFNQIKQAADPDGF